MGTPPVHPGSGNLSDCRTDSVHRADVSSEPLGPSGTLGESRLARRRCTCGGETSQTVGLVWASRRSGLPCHSGRGNLSDRFKGARLGLCYAHPAARNCRPVGNIWTRRGWRTAGPTSPQGPVGPSDTFGEPGWGCRATHASAPVGQVLESRGRGAAGPLGQQEPVGQSDRFLGTAPGGEGRREGLVGSDRTGVVGMPSNDRGRWACSVACREESAVGIGLDWEWRAGRGDSAREGVVR